MELINKKFAKKYLDSILNLCKENMQELFIDNFGGWSDNTSKNKFLKTITNGKIELFFTKNNEFIGFITFSIEKNNSRSILLEDIHIKREFQRKGFGKEIFSWFLKEIRTTNTHKHISQIKVFVFKNNPAHKFYLDLDFSIQEESSKDHTYVMIKKTN
jgi:ribosomal protein S18 acetylase RimI-like enzyme